MGSGGEGPGSVPPEDELGRLLREGRPIAEIAARLAVPVEVIEARRRGTGGSFEAVDRAGDVPEDGFPRFPHRQGAWLINRVLVLVVAAGVAASVLIFATGRPSGSHSAGAGTTPGALVTFGQLIVAPGGGRLTSVERPGLTTVRLPDGSVFASTLPPGWVATGSGSSVTLTNTDGSGWVALTLTPAPGAQFVGDSSGGFVLRTRSGGPGSVFARAEQPLGAVRYSVAVGKTGTVALRGPLLGPSEVMDSSTGEVLKVNQAVRVGTLGGGDAEATVCRTGKGSAGGQGPACLVLWEGQYAMPSPGAGKGCFTGPGVELLQLRSVTLVVENAGPPTAPGQCQAGTSFTVVPGQAIAGHGSYIVFARNPAGRVESAAVSRDGTLYVGAIVGRAGCPCMATVPAAPAGY